jgi:hypothetical protein
LLRQDLFEECCEEFTREMNRLRMEYRANLSSAECELERGSSRPRRDLLRSTGVRPALLTPTCHARFRRR